MNEERELEKMEMASPPRPNAHLSLERRERRVAMRYALHARVIFAWDDADGTHRESRGHTRDVGQKGAFVLAPDCPAKGAPVALSIFLPVIGAETRVMRLEVEGQVLRSGVGIPGANGSGSTAGFAVSHRRVNLFQASRPSSRK